MSVRITPNPLQDAEVGQVVGRPIHLPYVLLCTNGERFCGWYRTANSQEQFIQHAADRRIHESSCKGGLIVATRMP